MKVVIRGVDEDVFVCISKVTWTSKHYLELHHENGDLTLIPHDSVERVSVEVERG